MSDPDPPCPSARWALFLDVDGTLLDLAATPQAVVVPSGVVVLLGRVARVLGGALALVSGRPLATLDRLFAPFRPAAAGLHGLERRGPDGAVTRIAAQAAEIESARRRLAELPRRIPGVLLEDKELALAVHYRGAPTAEPELRRLIGAAAAQAPALELLAGKMVLELRPRGAGKDTAVDALMAAPPFRGRVPVFVGDDRTDEDGFAAVNRLGGVSIRVGTRGESVASYRLADAAAVRCWLARLADRLEPEREPAGAGSGEESR